MKKLFIALIISLFFVGCTHVSTSFTPTTEPKSPHFGEVKILDKTPDNFVEIGWVNCEGSHYVTWLNFLDAAKNKAGKNGANAIIFTPSNAKTGSVGKRSLICKAIYYER